MNSSEFLRPSSKPSPESGALDERRAVRDRRKKPTPPISRYTFRGRRRGSRRASDPRWNYYVDRPGTAAWLSVGLLVLLSSLDAIFTVHLLKMGGYEMNPFMRFILRFGHGPFLAVKYGLTGLGAFILLIHKNFYLWSPTFSVRNIVRFFIGMYLALVVYEVVLVF